MVSWHWFTKWCTKYDSSNNGEFWANTVHVSEIPIQLCQHLLFTLLGTRSGSYDCFLCSLSELVCISGNACMQLWIMEHKEIPKMMSLINERYKNAFKRGTMEDFMYILNHIIMEKIQRQEESKIRRTKNKTTRQWKRNVIWIYSNHTGVTRHTWPIKNESLPRLNTRVSLPRNMINVHALKCSHCKQMGQLIRNTETVSRTSMSIQATRQNMDS
jgi:hypothetical protein